MNRNYICPIVRPSKTLRNKFEQAFGSARWMYNQLLAENLEDYKKWESGELDKRPSVTQFSLCKRATKIRQSADWFTRKYPGGSAVHNCVAEHLATAFKNLFQGRAKFPQFKRKHGKKSFQFCCDNRQRWLKDDTIKVPGIGWIRVADVPAWIENKHLKRITIRKKGTRYFATLHCELDRSEIANLNRPVKQRTIAVDTGCSVLFATSDGDMYVRPDVERQRRLIEETQKKLDKAKNEGRDPSYINKLRQRIGNLHGKIERIQRDFSHKVSTTISENQVVVIEDLDVENMVGTGKRLNRIIHEAGMSSALTMLEYKVRDRGGYIQKVDPRYTSQKCSKCGHISKKNRKTQAKFVCQSCGFESNADLNAAWNILVAPSTNLELKTVLTRLTVSRRWSRRDSLTSALVGLLSQTGMNGEAVNQKVCAS